MKKKKNFEADEPCIVCRKEGKGMVTYHHLFTQKVYPEFSHFKWNQIPVCMDHHNLDGQSFHSKGTVYMADNFPAVKKWLLDYGWFFCEFVKKYRRDGF